MRRLIVLVLVAGIGWAIYWIVAARGVETGLEAGLEAARGAGWQADLDGLKVQGFPSRVDAVLTEPRLAPPSGDWGWKAPFLQLLALSYKPTEVIAVWPLRQRVVTPLGAAEVTSADMRASVTLVPGVNLPLSKATFVAEAPVAAFEGGSLALQELRLALEARPTRVAGYRAGIEAKAISWDGTPSLALERIWADADLEFDAPLDRHFAEKPPRLTGIELHNSDISLEGGTLNLSGALTQGPDGRWNGKVRLRSENASPFIALLAKAGWLSPREARDLTLWAIATSGPGVTLEVKNNDIFAGRFLVGRVPD